MIAVDSNILVYAHRVDSSWHAAAAARLRSLAESASPWALPWPCLHEFLAITTHPRIYDAPTPIEAALDQLAAWLESPSLRLLAEGSAYLEHLGPLLTRSSVAGARVHDARVAALCLQHGVSELWSADRDFGRFPELKVINPLV